MIDAFDAAAGQVKVETEGEKKIAESYQVSPDPGHPCNTFAVNCHVALRWDRPDSVPTSVPECCALHDVHTPNFAPQAMQCCEKWRARFVNAGAVRKAGRGVQENGP